MCIMMVVYRMVEDFPVIIGANRDEFYDRDSHEPACLNATPNIWGGRDARAGGTWMGVNEYGLVVGLTNRRLHDAPQPSDSRRSRGLLCLDALRHCRASDVAALLASEPPDYYNPFNLLVFDATVALWIAYDGKPSMRLLAPGVHVLANTNLNDMDTGRVRRAHRLMQMNASRTLPPVLHHLKRACGDHEPGMRERDRVCIHRSDARYGTVSSTVLAISPQRQKSVYHYASGHPCHVRYRDYSSYLMSSCQPRWRQPC